MIIKTSKIRKKSSAIEMSAWGISVNQNNWVDSFALSLAAADPTLVEWKISDDSNNLFYCFR